MLRIEKGEGNFSRIFQNSLMVVFEAKCTLFMRKYEFEMVQHWGTEEIRLQYVKLELEKQLNFYFGADFTVETKIGNRPTWGSDGEIYHNFREREHIWIERYLKIHLCINVLKKKLI